MIKVGITGQAGFVGTHLFNTLGLYPDKFVRIPFEDEFFYNPGQLNEFVSQCDAIVHLAAMNRHNDPRIIYEKNIELVQHLITACEETNSTPHILFSSSTQEERDNPYGKSKKEGRRMLEQWADQNNAQFTGFVIPNVFGPFGHPYYNSFIATFCHQLTHHEQPHIDVDGQVKLIYVSELVKEFIDKIEEHGTRMTTAEIAGQAQIEQINTACPDSSGDKISENQSNPSHPPNFRGRLCSINTYHVPHTYDVKVSDVLRLLEAYKHNYYEQGEIPDLDTPFERNLFNTFLCYIDHKSFFPFHLSLKSDQRGSFVETVKLNSGGQVSFSTTVPGVTRGNHFHTRKAERFAVIKGKARIEIRKIGTDKVYSFELDGTQPSFVDMPIWHTHNITNIGDEELYTIFWINEKYDETDPDTWFEKV